MVYVKIMNRVNSYPICDSPLWRSARFHFVAEIAPKSPFLCVNRCPVRCGLRANIKAVRYGLNIALNGSCKGLFVTRGSSSIVREI